jgi:hypothetical protein
MLLDYARPLRTLLREVITECLAQLDLAQFSGRRETGHAIASLIHFVIARSEATKQSRTFAFKPWIASRSLSSGAHSRDPLARNDGFNANA